MRLRRILVSLFAASIALTMMYEPARSQISEPRRGVQQPKKAEPKRTAKPRPDPATQLNALFEALKLAPDEQIARQIEGRIEARLGGALGPTACWKPQTQVFRLHRAFTCHRVYSGSKVRTAGEVS